MNRETMNKEHIIILIKTSRAYLSIYKQSGQINYLIKAKFIMSIVNKQISKYNKDNTITYSNYKQVA